MNQFDCKILYNGKPFTDSTSFPCNNDVHLQLYYPLLGGKGGFGSMLRAIGAQIEKTTNREACRDLSGRRLRDVNEEKRIKEYVKKRDDKSAENKKAKKEKLKRLAHSTGTAAVHYDDKEYDQIRDELPDKIEDSIIAGLEKSSKTPVENGKRKAEEASASSSSDSSTSQKAVVPGTLKKPKLWLGLDEGSTSSSEDDDDEEEKEEGDQTRKEQKVSSAN